MNFKLLAVALSASLVSAAPNAGALPWAKANPQAQAAAAAYADAYAEAQAIGHADPEAYALAASADDCATIACHAVCGLLIIEGQTCSTNKENNYKGPYNKDCLCTDGSAFKQKVDGCLDCGWTLWKYYGVYVTEALAACNLPTEPTGTLRCSTTLTDEYTPDYNIQGCSYLGNCPSTGATTSKAAETTAQTSSKAAETTAQTSSKAAETTAQTSSKAAEATAQTSSKAAETTAQTSSKAAEATSSKAAEGTSQGSAAPKESSASMAKPAPSAASSQPAGASTTHAISTFQGAAAAKVVPAVGALAVAALLI